MTVITAYCAKDVDLLVENLKWQADLDGIKAHDIVLLSSRPVPRAKDEAVIAAARGAYWRIKAIKQGAEDERGWPMSCNALFKLALAYARDQLHQPFFWWEPDCIQIKAGALDSLALQYQEASMPFLGRITEKPWAHMTGCAVYPANPIRYNPRMLDFDKTQWDIVDPKLVIEKCHPTNLIQHVWSFESYDKYGTGPAPTFPDLKSLERLEKDAVFFHRNKDGSLIQRLKERQDAEATAKAEREKAAIEVMEEAIPSQNLTTVITTFKRPSLCREAIRSVQRAGIKNIVVSATGIDPSSDKELKRCEKQGATVIRCGQDANLSWLAGVSAARTEYVNILHDDDKLLPDYWKAVGRVLDTKPPFVIVQGAFHNHGSGKCAQLGDLAKGLNDSKIVLDFLMDRKRLSLSPVCGIFRRDDAVLTLEEAEWMFGPANELRPGFVVGNDMLLYLRACLKHDKFFYIPKSLVSYGVHKESTTVAEGAKLLAWYDRIRDYSQRSNPYPDNRISGDAVPDVAPAGVQPA